MASTAHATSALRAARDVRIEAIGAGELPAGLREVAALLQGPPGGEVGQGRDAVLRSLAAVLALRKRSGRVVQLHGPRRGGSRDVAISRMKRIRVQIATPGWHV